MQIPFIYIVQNKDLINSENRYMDDSFDTQYEEKVKTLKQ